MMETLKIILYLVGAVILIRVVSINLSDFFFG